MYRSLQLLCGKFNGCSRLVLFPIAMTIVPVLQIFACFVTIKLHDEIPMPEFLIFPVIFLDGLLVNLVLCTVASSIFSRSRKLLLIWGKRLGTHKRGFIAKSLKSCFSLKARFGNSFVDEFTPLVLQGFCISQTASLLLLSN